MAALVLSSPRCSPRWLIRSAAGSDEQLSAGSATVGEVTGDFGLSKPTISRHLRILEEAGVVSRVIDGRTHRLELESRTLAEAAGRIQSQRSRWERLFDVVGEYLEERR